MAYNPIPRCPDYRYGAQRQTFPYSTGGGSLYFAAARNCPGYLLGDYVNARGRSAVFLRRGMGYAAVIYYGRENNDNLSVGRSNVAAPAPSAPAASVAAAPAPAAPSAPKP